MVALHQERLESVSYGATPVSELLGVIGRGRPAWQRDAACREHPEVDFFPGGKRRNREANAEAAKAICRTCLVRDECLSWAIEHEEVGVWGGTSEAERRRLRSGKVA